MPRLQVPSLQLLCLVWACIVGYQLCLASDYRIDGRFSFSLSTFDPDGKLGQVERATQAAALGTPVVAVCKPGRIILCAPQVLPSPLVKDDGTARFARISPTIAVAHSGISADGRVLVAAAQRLAIEHAYTFDEAIPIEIFLEEVSLLFQEYTMKPGARPFGVTLLVADLSSSTTTTTANNSIPKLYRIDPSGSVQTLGRVAVVNGKFNADLETRLEEIADRAEETLVEEDRRQVTRVLAEAIDKAARDKRAESSLPNGLTILSASLTKEHGLTVERKEPQRSSE
jgi:20S proteasome subunit alpha 2